MGQLHIRGIDDELVKRLKHVAIDTGVSVKDYVVGAIERAVGGDPPRKAAIVKATDVGRQSFESPKTGSSPSAEKPTPPKPKSDPEKIPGVKRGKNFTDTW